MGTLFGDATLVENDDMVGVSNRRETVSDHQSGAPFGEMGERLMDQLFVDGVEMRRGLVKDEDRSIFEQGPGDGESLPLSAGKLNAALADHGIVGKRQLGDEMVRVSALRGFLDGFIGGLRLGQAQVLPNGGVEKVGLLRDQSNFRSQVIESERPQGRFLPTKFCHGWGPRSEAAAAHRWFYRLRKDRREQRFVRAQCETKHLAAPATRRGPYAKLVLSKITDGGRSAVRRQRNHPGTVRHGDRFIFDGKDPPGGSQSLHEFFERAGYLTHRAESRHSQDRCQGQERAGHFPLRHEPNAGYQNRQRADTREGLVQACLPSLFRMKPNLRRGDAPTVARQLSGEPLLTA